MKSYDVAVIGSGPGGYVSAIRCSQLGMSVAIVEKYNSMGGTCLNVGCIPSKALLDSSHHFENAVKHFDAHGIELPGEVKVNLEKMMSRKQSVVDQTTAGIDFLMKKNNIDVYHGVGSFKDATHVNVVGDTNLSIEAKHIIIATGSKPTVPSFVTLDKERIITSTEALKLKEIPKHLIIIGGGVIGLELGQVYNRLGSEVTVIEYMDRIIPTMDMGLSKELNKIFKKQKFNIHVSHKVTSVNRSSDTVTVIAQNNKGEEVSFEGDYCLVSIGRSPYTDHLNLEAAGVKLNDRGQVDVNTNLQTNVKNIYAIGDVIKGAMLAHKAEEEGVFVAETIAGQKPHIDYNLIPGVVYTWPEVAAVGQTEQQLQKAGIDYKTGQFPMRALGRSRASMDLDGFVKILADAKTDEILGVHMIGARCADLIAEAVVAMEYRASAEDISRISHAHPTFTEAIKEAALAATENRALHV